VKGEILMAKMSEWNPCETEQSAHAHRKIMLSLENRYPSVSWQIEHEACLAAARLEGKTNVRHHVAPVIGGWGAWLLLYAPELEGDHQRFELHGQDDWPERFKTAQEARSACELEEENLLRQFDEQSKATEKQG